MTTRPPMIRTDFSNAFAHHTMKVRVPTTIRDVQRLNPDYPASIQSALTQLAETIEKDGHIPALESLAPDADLWAASYARHEGHTWLQTDWFFAEIYFYRLLIEKVRWWETGRDPFAPKKIAELASPDLWALLDRAAQTGNMPLEQSLRGRFHSALWGNRIDLSFAPSLAHGSSGSHEDVIADDSRAAAADLTSRPGPVHLVADNTGTELAMDLVLADTLIHQAGREVIFHLKMHPTFVSDAIVSDALTLMKAMLTAQGSPAINNLGKRLYAALDEGHLRFAPDFYWNSADLLWDMPERLRAIFRPAALVLIKGDANYRRIVGDALWPPETPFADVTDYFPAPLLALRTLKSDPVVGLQPGLAERLQVEDQQWRVNGRRGIIQYRNVG